MHGKGITIAATYLLSKDEAIEGWSLQTEPCSASSLSRLSSKGRLPNSLTTTSLAYASLQSECRKNRQQDKRNIQDRHYIPV